MNTSKCLLAASLLSLLPAGSIYPQWPGIDLGEAPAEFSPPPAGTPLSTEILAHAGEPLNQGRLLFNTRFRYEHAAQQGLEAVHAFTLRTRIGYETPRYHGFYGLTEFENTWAINYSDYAPFPAPFNNGKTVIADPRNAELNRLLLAYEGFNSTAVVGRQTIALDNQRFVGPVAWRQNDQTFDAVRFTTEIVEGFWFSYTWNWRVNRIYGVYAPDPNLQRYHSNNHFLNVHYRGIPYGTLGAYFYYLDLEGAPTISGSTAGLFFDGSHALSEEMKLLYRLEYAFQTNNAATANASFWENYWHARVGLDSQGWQVGLGFENLGGNGTRSFQTPLATLHAFNGWSDVFLTTPPNGLRDYHAWAEAPMPSKIKARLELHFFTTQNTDQTLGKEAGISFQRQLTSNLSVLIKAAYYDGQNGVAPAYSANRTKFWLQFDFAL